MILRKNICCYAGRRLLTFPHLLYFSLCRWVREKRESSCRGRGRYGWSVGWLVGYKRQRWILRSTVCRKQSQRKDEDCKHSLLSPPNLFQLTKFFPSDSALATNSTYLTTRSCAVPTMRRGCSSPHSRLQ